MSKSSFFVNVVSHLRLLTVGGELEIKSLKGMHDLFGAELARWRRVEDLIQNGFAAFGYHEIRMPVLEKIEVVSRTVGDLTDIVEKQMYTLTDLSKDVLVMRPEGTAPFIRAIVEHQLHLVPGPQRYFYYLPMFRHERPQKGRLRQFHQFGGELIQDPSPQADAEIIALVDSLFKKVGLREFKTHLNSIGCNTCRPPYRLNLATYLKNISSSLCEQCVQKIERAPMRVLDCKNETCRDATLKAPRISEQLCKECEIHHNQVRHNLKLLGVSFFDDPNIVRGLDYYSRSAFEFSSSLLGAQDALGGGGRYDGLSEHFSNSKVSGVGFAAGMERVMIALGAQGLNDENLARPNAYFVPLGSAAFELLFPLSFRLKNCGISNEMTYDFSKGLKNQLKQADRSGATWAFVVGDDEIAKSKVIVKEMKTGTQSEISIDQIENFLKDRKGSDQP